MTDFANLAAYLRRWDARRRRRELLAALPLGLAVGLALGLAATLLSRARPWLARGEIIPVAVLLALAGAAIAALIVLLRRRSLGEQARFADRQFGLRERMTAAVEIHDGALAADAAVAERQLQDALASAATVNAARQLPLTVNARDWLPAAATLALLAVALWLPNPQEAVLQEQRAVAAAVEQATADLTAAAEAITANEALTAEQQAALQQPLDEALAALNEPGISREAAVAALSAAETELRRLNQAADGAALNQALAQAGVDGAGASALTQALQAGDPVAAGAAAAGLAGEVGGMSAGEQAALAAELAAAAGALAATDEALATALAEAAAALSQGDAATAAEALNETAEALESRAALAAAAEQAATAAGQLAEARQAVAQAGSAPGDGGEGVAEGDGQQPGGESSGAAGEAAGGEQGAGGATGGEGTNGVATGGPAPGGGHVENVYVPPPADLEGEGQALELEVQCLQDPADCGPVGGQSPSPLPAEGGGQVPYDQVFGDYRDAAFESLAAGDIPIRLQSLIRDYFAALEP
jgi:hypothetical protein